MVIVAVAEFASHWLKVVTAQYTLVNVVEDVLVTLALMAVAVLVIFCAAPPLSLYQYSFIVLPEVVLPLKFKVRFAVP
jgi:hypothetical protein